MTTGNWGTTPTEQALYLQDKSANRYNRSKTAHGQLGSFAQFAREHAEWFELVRNTVPRGTPQLHLRTEELTGGAEALHGTMQRAFRFLGLPRYCAESAPIKLMKANQTIHVLHDCWVVDPLWSTQAHSSIEKIQ